MSEKLPMNAEAYLERIKNKKFEVSDEEVEESYKRLSKPFKKMRKNGMDAVDVKFDKTKLRIRYAHEVQNGLSARKIIELVFEIGNQRIDLIEQLPPNTQVFVGGRRFASNESGHAVTDHTEGTMNTLLYLRDEVYSPQTLLVLLHEIGHAFDERVLEDAREGIGGKDAYKDSPIAETIRKERAANAFVLKLTHRYVKDEKLRRDIVNVLIHDALKTYYADAKRKLAEPDQGIKGVDLGLNSQDVKDYLEE